MNLDILLIFVAAMILVSLASFLPDDEAKFIARMTVLIASLCILLALGGCASVFSEPTAAAKPYWHTDIPNYQVPRFSFHLPQALTEFICQSHKVSACTIRSAWYCTMIIGPQATACVIGHENAHCDGLGHYGEPGDPNQCGDSPSPILNAHDLARVNSVSATEPR